MEGCENTIRDNLQSAIMDVTFQEESGGEPYLFSSKWINNAPVKLPFRY